MATPLLNQATTILATRTLATPTLATPTLATLLLKGGTVKLHKEYPITNLPPFIYWMKSTNIYKIICYLKVRMKTLNIYNRCAAYTVIAVKVDEMGTLHGLIID